MKQLKVKDFLDYFSYFVLLIAFGFMIYFAYVSYYPFEIIKFNNTDNEGNGIFKVLTPEVRKGEILLYVSEFEKLMNIPGEISCYFEDGIVYQLTDRVNNNKVGRHDEVRAIDVPLSLPPETYRYGCKVNYKLTMGRTITYTFFTDYFKIVE